MPIARVANDGAFAPDDIALHHEPGTDSLAPAPRLRLSVRGYFKRMLTPQHVSSRHPHLSVTPTSPGTPPGNSMI